MMYRLTVACLISLFGPIWASAQVGLEPEVHVPVGRLASVVITDIKGDVSYQAFGANLDIFREYTPDASTLKLRVLGYKPGRAWLVVSSSSIDARLDKIFDQATPEDERKTLIDQIQKDMEVTDFKFSTTHQDVCEIIIGTPPDPDPRPDPDDGDDDNKPDPEPNPDPAPIPEDGLRVLIVYETETAGNLSAGHRAILFGRVAREFMDSVCVKEGNTAEWRIYDSDIDTDRADETWAKAMKRDRSSLPWLVVSNGKAGFEGPLPESVDEFKALVGKFK